MTRPLSVLFHSCAEREVGTGQSERAPCCLATGSWLGACLLHSPGIEPYLSPAWLHRLLALSGFPSRQALRAKERQVSWGPEGRWLQLTAASKTGRGLAEWLGLPLWLSPSSGLLCPQVPFSEFTSEEFEPLSWLSSLVPDSSLTVGVVPLSSLP